MTTTISSNATGLVLVLFSSAGLWSNSADAQLVIDSDSIAGRHNAIAIGLDSRPIIAYSGGNGLRVAHCQTNRCDQAALYDHGGSATEISIVVRNDGRPLIAYYSLGSLNLELFDCADAACSSGSPRSIGDQGRFSAAAIRPDGRPLIAYHRPANPRGLRLFDCVDTACSDGDIRVLESTTDPIGLGVHPAITISDGLPIISYVSGFPLNELRVFRCQDTDCMTGTINTLGNGANSHSQIESPPGGMPLVTYYTGQQLRLLACADADCSSAQSQTLDLNNSGANNSMTINADGLAVISYVDAANAALKSYACEDVACTTGEAETLDAGDIQRATAIVQRAQSGPIISYHDAAGQSLKVFACSDQRCSVTLVSDGFEQADQ